MTQVAIVTGGASGIGAALSRAIAQRGIEVVLADRQRERAEEEAQAIIKAGGKAVAAELDVRDFSAFQGLVEATVARSGRIDYLYNNAGIAIGGEVDTYSLADWLDVFAVNLNGVVHGIQAVYPRMIAQRSGHIINTASMAGLMSTAGEASYGATKHAVVSLTKSLRIEAHRHNVRFSVLCPGAIRTPILTGGKYGRLNLPGVSNEQALAIWERVRPMDPDVLARKTLEAVDRNQAIIVLPAWWKALWYLERLSPTLSMYVWRKFLERTRAELAPGAASAPQSPL
ncbi:MAG: SDR family oxidoreductase [Myxococcota bacterium]